MRCAGAAELHPRTIRRNGHQDYVGGYFVGFRKLHSGERLLHRVDPPVDWKYAFERQWLFYKLWGRLLYNPATPDSVFEAEFVRRYGEAARPLARGLRLASLTS